MHHTTFFKAEQKNIKCVLGQYLKFVLFSAPDQPLENCVWKYFWGDSVMSSLKYFGYQKSWPEVSDTVPEFTLGTDLHCFIWSKSVARPGQ